ncbi:MAG: hypothetical protein IIX61_02690 [Loktanella sp.]|nr:hypothetical protein [Loktanella sp.]
MASEMHMQADEIRGLLEQRLGIRARSLEAQVRKARRHLPRALRRELIYFAQSESLVDNPKLHRMLNPARLEAAHRDAVAFLSKVNSSTKRKAEALQIAASIAFGLLVMGIVLIAALIQRNAI